MKITYPHTIENGQGEKIIFHSLEQEPDGDKVIVENFVIPGHGSTMHTHFLQDESLTVVKGKIGYQVMDQEKQFANDGETILFERGVPHRFWNAGDDILNCNAYLMTRYSKEYDLPEIPALSGRQLCQLPVWLGECWQNIKSLKMHPEL